MRTESIVYLSGACDEAFDEEDKPLNDWAKIQQWTLYGKEFDMMLRWSKLRCIGPMAKWFITDSMSYGYEFAICFIEAHEAASKMIGGIVDNKDLCDIVLKESKTQTELAYAYIQNYVELPFPEIAKACQQRRAEYYILNHKLKYVNGMLHHGQVEPNDAKNLLGEIDQKIWDLKS